MFKPGTIRKISVKDFVTYSYAELYPGPHLNMIIGPNGTGKSTMVAAIILGLGGNPKVVGRGSKVSEYVKHNCEFAVVNIFLQGENQNEMVKITREFNIYDKNRWQIDARIVSQQQVFDCVKQFRIQVDNLCQFLPQDRVQNFAKLNKKDLLTETLKALCREDLLEKQQNLIKVREQHKNLVQWLDKHGNQLQQAQDLNIRLEGRVKNLQMKEKFTEAIRHLERKMAWILYEEMRTQLGDVSKDKNSAQSIYEKHLNIIRPMETEIIACKKVMSGLQHNVSVTKQSIRETEGNAVRNVEKVTKIKDAVRKIKDDLSFKLVEIEQWDTEINETRKKITQYKNTETEILTQCKKTKEEEQKLANDIRKFNSHSQALRIKRDEVCQKRENETSRIRYIENDINKLENVRQNRLEHLQRLNQDAYRGLLWLRENKHLFQDEIYEPMMLEINVLDSKQGKYLENVIAVRDRYAFTCVNIEDMNKLIRSLREQQRLSVNVVNSTRNANYKPRVPIERLQRYGFYTYMINLFTAPEPIMNYLCKTYNIHNIPIGDKSTNSSYESIPNEIRLFFSDTHRYSVTFSKYSGQKSTRQSQMRSDGTLSLSLDIVRLETLKGQISDVEKTVENCNVECQSYENQLNQLNQNIAVLRERIGVIHTKNQEVRAITMRIKSLEEQEAKMRLNKKSPDVLKTEADEKIKQALLMLFPMQESLLKEARKLAKTIQKHDLNTLKFEEERRKVSCLENEIVDSRRQCEEAEEVYKAIKDKYNGLMTQAKELLAQAKSLSNGFTPADGGFGQFRKEYNRLSDDLQELNAEKDQLQSRIACLNTADNGELEEYQNRLAEIDDLTKSIEKSNMELGRISAKMERMQHEWLEPTKNLIGDINDRFSSAFERMGCAGEISICPGENEKDFSEYGISVKVTYRNGEPLQELNSNVQSGGERAVATATFMLSLQELTPVPFRCVDEINQGMDASNEKRIFELIVETTCQDTSSQYFLVTPKLVKNLNYNDHIMVHIVHNGPFVATDKKWGFSKLCNPQCVQIG